MLTTMYPSIAHVEQWAQWAERTGLDDRPALICEFSHAMGNSNGSLDDYLDLWREPAICGGYIWTRRPGACGTARTVASSGHTAATSAINPTMRTCINGLVGPDLTPHPVMRQPRVLGQSRSSLGVEGAGAEPSRLHRPGLSPVALVAGGRWETNCSCRRPRCRSGEGTDGLGSVPCETAGRRGAPAPGWSLGRRVHGLREATSWRGTRSALVANR